MTNKFYRKDAIINVHVADIEEYNNNGNLVGGWVGLPIKKSDFKAFLKTIGNPKKIGINDCYINNSAFNGLKIEDFKGIQELNEVCKRMERMERINPYKVDIFNALYEALGDFKTALDYLESDDYVFYENMTMEEVAQEQIRDIPSYLGKYIDSKAFANDMRYDGYYETSRGVIYIV